MIDRLIDIIRWLITSLVVFCILLPFMSVFDTNILISSSLIIGWGLSILSEIISKIKELIKEVRIFVELLSRVFPKK